MPNHPCVTRGLMRSRCSLPKPVGSSWLVLAGLVLLLMNGVAAQRSLQQTNSPQRQVIEYNPLNHTVYVADAKYFPNTDLRGAAAIAAAAYPDPVLENPNGWRFKAVANTSMVLGSSAGSALTRSETTADSKLAPAIALASADVESGGVTVWANRVAARARPGLQYGVTMAKTDGKLVSNAPFDPVSGTAAPVFLFMAQEAEAGQGQVVNLVNAELEGNNLVLGDSRGKAIATRWYLAPGHAVMGQRWDIKGGQAAVYSKNVVRASQGTATGGVLHKLHGRGNIPPAYSIRRPLQTRSTRFLARNGAAARADNRAYVDAGAAQTGSIQMLRSDNGDATMVGLSQARTAVGNAAAGALNLGWAENGYVYIGDYWEELSNPGNAVVATNYGRGPSQAGQINIALTPNKGARIGGTVVATAVQGSATGGAFTLANGADELLTDQDVAAVTSEYTASAGNVGVSISSERNSIINTAVAKSDTGSAFSYDIATGVVAEQNSVVGSVSATTSTGQAAAVSASQAVGGVQSESQGSALSKTTSGNALALGSAFSGSMYTGRAVSTSGATTSEGTALSSSFSGVVSADSEAATASSAVTAEQGNTASLAQGYGLGVFQGKSTTASASGTRAGSTTSLALGVGTGLVLSKSIVASTAQTADGHAQALSGSLALGGMTSSAEASSVGQSGTGDAVARADAVGLGSLHGEAKARAVSVTGCADCVSDAVANAVSVGLVADASAAAKSDSPINPGNSLANAMAFGYISRTSNGGSSRVSVGPAQALSGGFAVSAPRRIADAAAAAASASDFAKRAAATARNRQQQQQQWQQQLPAAPELTEEDLAVFGSEQQEQQQQLAVPKPAREADNKAKHPAEAEPEQKQHHHQHFSQSLQQQQQQPLPGPASAGGSPSGSSAFNQQPTSTTSTSSSSSSTVLPGREPLPGTGFMQPMLQRLQHTVSAAEQIGAMKSMSATFTAAADTLPLYALQPQLEAAQLQAAGGQLHEVKEHAVEADDSSLAGEGAAQPSLAQAAAPAPLVNIQRYTTGPGTVSQHVSGAVGPDNDRDAGSLAQEAPPAVLPPKPILRPAVLRSWSDSSPSASSKTGAAPAAAHGMPVEQPSSTASTQPASSVQVGSPPLPAAPHNPQKLVTPPSPTAGESHQGVRRSMMAAPSV